ncbi:MAG: IS200/IS605 family transposase [Phycisphaerales bacterium JB039]
MERWRRPKGGGDATPPESGARGLAQPEGLLKRYLAAMASTFMCNLLHIAFSTKGRRPIITPEMEAAVYPYVGGICRSMKSPLLTIGGTADHVHLLVSLAKTVALADLMMQVKRDSSKVIRQTIREFHWQDGYFAFSIGASGVEDVRRYVAT